MNRRKKIYCGVSFFVGTIALIFALLLMSGIPVHATAGGLAGSEAGGLAGSQAGSTGAQQETAGDNTNGVSLYWNNSNGDVSGNVKILLFLTVISLAPSILILLTSFTRIVIVLHFARTAIGTQTVPPNQVLVGLSLILTLFIMNPIFSEINETAIQPFDKGEITQEEAFAKGVAPLREFMFSQTQRKDLALFCDIAGLDEIDFGDLGNEEVQNDIPTTVLIPSFIIGELRKAFIMGFLIYIPFIVIDMVVASVLMSMGMMMLPPTTISMPFKILLFVLADGWNLVIGSLVKTFY